MAEAPAFDFLCSAIERQTNLDRLEARGTVRIALKRAGLDPETVTPEQMKVVVEKLLEAELGARGVSDAGTVCAEIREGLSGVESSGGKTSPEAVFERLGG